MSVSASATLLIQQPDGSTHEVPLETEHTVIGRAESCAIVLAGQLISRQHARIQRIDRTYYLEDLGSHNGTTLNGQPLVGAQALQDGDCIELGGMRRIFFVDGDATSTRPLPPTTGIWLDMATQDVWVDGQRISPPLSLAQFTLLQLLTAHAGRVCSRADIVAAVWPDAAGGVSEDAVDGLVKRLRARLSEAPNGDRQVQSIRGRGLILYRVDEIR